VFAAKTSQRPFSRQRRLCAGGRNDDRHRDRDGGWDCGGQRGSGADSDSDDLCRRTGHRLALPRSHDAVVVDVGSCCRLADGPDRRGAAGEPTRLAGRRRQCRHRMDRRPSQPGRRPHSPGGDQCLRAGRNCLCSSARRDIGGCSLPLRRQRAHRYRRCRRGLCVVHGTETAAGARSTSHRNSGNAGDRLLVSLGSRHRHRGVIRHAGGCRRNAPKRCGQRMPYMHRGHGRRCGRVESALSRGSLAQRRGGRCVTRVGGSSDRHDGAARAHRTR
jgi:hypothetical protein